MDFDVEGDSTFFKELFNSESGMVGARKKVEKWKITLEFHAEI